MAWHTKAERFAERIAQDDPAVYYAYNPLRFDTLTSNTNISTRSLFPAGAAGDFTYHQALQSFAPEYQLKEPRKTFRFTVATTF